MTALSRVGRRALKGDAVSVAASIIHAGCAALAAPAADQKYSPGETLLFLRAVQCLLYQEALVLQDSSRGEALDHLLSLLHGGHVPGESDDDRGLEALELQVEVLRTAACLMYDAPAVAGLRLDPLVRALRPLLHAGRDAATTTSSVAVAATLLQQEQQAARQRQVRVRHLRALLSAHAADALANAARGLGPEVEPLASDLMPLLIANAHAWTALVTAALSLEGLAAEHGAGVDVYVEALGSTLRSVHTILAEVHIPVYEADVRHLCYYRPYVRLQTVCETPPPRAEAVDRI